MYQNINIKELPPPPPGFWYRLGRRFDGSEYVWVRTGHSDGHAAWCVDQYTTDEGIRWRTESYISGWNTPHEGLDGFITAKDACIAMCNYHALMFDMEHFKEYTG